MVVSFERMNTSLRSHPLNRNRQAKELCMFAFTISIILIAFAVDIALTILNYRNRHAPVPQNVDDVYNENDYKKVVAVLDGNH